MYRAAVCFLVVALLAGAIGFSGEHGVATLVARVVFAFSFVVAGVTLLADARQTLAGQ